MLMFAGPPVVLLETRQPLYTLGVARTTLIVGPLRTTRATAS
jgi:hypothetical protein